MWSTLRRPRRGLGGGANGAIHAGVSDPLAVKEALLDALRAVLRPLVRLLIARGVTYPACNGVLKEVYLEVARRHFGLSFKQQTDSRIALVTGITRKEIGQLRRGQAPPPAARAGLDETLATRAVARWRAGPPYASDAGAPHLLAYESSERVGFVDLAAELGGDIPPRAVLDELLRRGAVTLTPRGQVRLVENPALNGATAAAAPGEDLDALDAEFVAALARLRAAAGQRGADDAT